MRTRVFVILFALAGPMASAQQGFHFGAVGEFHRSWQAFKPQHDVLRARGLNAWGAGLVLQWGLSPRVSLALEPGLLNKGGVVGVPRESATITTRLRYLELPVRLRVAFARGAVRPYAVLGPSIGYLHRARAHALAPGVLDDERDVKDQARSLELGASAGLGLAFGDVGQQMFVEALYARGFTNLDRSDEGTLRNQGVHVRLGLLFGGAR